MGIQEPATPLWAAVKAIYDAWPPDDEIAAADLGGAWRRGGDVLTQGASATTAAGDAAFAAWRDGIGGTFQGRSGEFATALTGFGQTVGTLAERAELYGREIASAKTTITETISANEDIYTLLGNPLFGALGVGLQQAFAGLVANDLQGMIADKAALLRAPAGPPVPPIPPDPNAPKYHPPINRGLTPEERKLAEEYFGSSLDLDRIRLTDGGPLSVLATFDRKARATEDLITFPQRTLSTPQDKHTFNAWLLHELTHQYQYQRGGNEAKLLPASITGPYDPGSPKELRDARTHGKTLSDFNTEQQGDIVRQYYFHKNGLAEHPDPGAYEPFVKDIQEGKNPFPPPAPVPPLPSRRDGLPLPR